MRFVPQCILRRLYARRLPPPSRNVRQNAVSGNDRMGRRALSNHRSVPGRVCERWKPHNETYGCHPGSRHTRVESSDPQHQVSPGAQFAAHIATCRIIASDFGAPSRLTHPLHLYTLLNIDLLRVSPGRRHTVCVRRRSQRRIDRCDGLTLQNHCAAWLVESSCMIY